MTEKAKTTKKPIEILIDLYKKLGSGERADLRRVEEFHEVENSLAFHRIYLGMQQQFKELNDKNPDKKISTYRRNILSCLLVFWRDRGANPESLENIGEPLGKLFAAGIDRNNKGLKVKQGRYKRMIASTTLDEAFKTLRPILRMFRHDPMNWQEIADFLSALDRNDQENHKDYEKQIHYRKRNLNQYYFEAVIDYNLDPQHN